MGCCVSTPNKSPIAPNHHHPHSSAVRSNTPHHSKAAPPPEEETVKEVLSETPTPKPHVPKIVEDEEEKKIGSNPPPIHKIREEENINNNNNVDKLETPLMMITTTTTTEEVSEVSEICSMSESLSTVTTEKREDEVKSPAKFRNRATSGERREIGRSPARRSEPSPGRVRSVPGRERRPAVAAEGRRRDLGESSGRRSRSPATRAAETGGAGRAGVGRSPSGRKTGKSPVRERSEVNEKTRKPEEDTWLSPTTTNESLENPLVSLECFIFL
ncbi:hypothetical protein LOK49_LG09G00627 [Camellia lanceoleosa]|uniref:Uncharacterized protein n=1 Tax=Camellia lanceoleosa TaxID=1840588 RepID=A0ACC0GID2_9ERIC|nr:hypothetical protein LOK49_LG09G00627 [Camellia lanceoleosa]